MSRLNDFLICKLQYKAWLLFRSGSPTQRGWELHRAKKDVECARAFLSVERRKYANY